MPRRVSNELPDFSSNIRAEIDHSGARVRVGYPRWLGMFLQKDVIGLTLGSRVYLSSALLERSESYIERIVRHELAHVRQMQRLGVIAFGYNYLREYMELRFSGHRHFEAYSRISFEVEAQEAEQG